MTQIDQLAAKLLGKKGRELEPEEHRVLSSIADNSIVSRDAEDVAGAQETFGERLSDRVAAIGGSWGFIIAFGVVLFAWVLLNTDILPRLNAVFDPYPYIFLNLMLSMVAAIQAPVIMMSQNRKDDKDRIAAGLDYEVNLRAELDIMRLHHKIDAFDAARLDSIADKQDRILALLEQRP